MSFQDKWTWRGGCTGKGSIKICIAKNRKPFSITYVKLDHLQPNFLYMCWPQSMVCYRNRCHYDDNQRLYRVQVGSQIPSIGMFVPFFNRHTRKRRCVTRSLLAKTWLVSLDSKPSIRNFFFVCPPC